MAVRQVFVPNFTDDSLVEVRPVNFIWHSGMSLQQKQRSIDELHRAAVEETGLSSDSILEVSTKSRVRLGRSLSALNLSFVTRKQERKVWVESAYQASKVFRSADKIGENFQFKDLMSVDGKTARRDPRLKQNNELLHFRFFGEYWPLTPDGAFYAWIYLNALNQHPSLMHEIQNYNAFTDIEFSPIKSYSCQALAVALFVSLKNRGELSKALSSKQDFLTTMSRVPSAHYHKSRNKNKPPIRNNSDRESVKCEEARTS